jgi:hypothetical protein
MNYFNFKHGLRRILFFFGYQVTRIRPLKEIRDLISLLHPIQTDLIRIGGQGDGGYLIPNDLEGITTCFSPGVSTITNFESELDKLGIKCYLADYSVDLPLKISDNISFLKKYVAPFHSETEIDFQDWVEKNIDKFGDSMLQMDIEGAEYATLLSCSSEVLRRFRIIVVEFHNLDQLFSERSFPFVRDCLKKILNDFYVVHIHPNNVSTITKKVDISVPSTMEFSFLRKDRISNLNYSVNFPHELDSPNSKSNREMFLPKIWYK